MLRKPKEWSQTSSNIAYMSAEMRATVHSPHCATFMELDKMTLVCKTNQFLSSAPFPQCICICMVRPGRRQNDIFLDKSITGARRRSLASPRPISGHGVGSYPGIDSGGVSLDFALLYTLCRINRPHSISSAKLCILCNRMKNGTVQSWTLHRRHKQAILFMDNGEGKVS